MSVLTFENIVSIIIVCSIFLAITGVAVFNLPKILNQIFFIAPIVLMLVVVSSEALLKNAASTESRTEIQEVTSKSKSSNQHPGPIHRL